MEYVQFFLLIPTTSMNTLLTDPVASLLTRLFAEAEENNPLSSRLMTDVSQQERERLMRSKTEYLDLYAELKDFPLAVSRETGALLYMLARNSRARTIVEFGTSFGVSTLHLAAALRDNGGGQLITTEFEPSKLSRARENLRVGGLLDLVDIRAGDALQTLRTDLPEVIDLLLLDGAKALYTDVLEMLEPRLRPGAFILADNADYCPSYMAYVSSPQNGYMSVSVSEEVELSMRVG